MVGKEGSVRDAGFTQSVNKNTEEFAPAITSGLYPCHRLDKPPPTELNANPLFSRDELRPTFACSSNLLNLF